MNDKFELRKILVTTDLSDVSWAALEPALELARKFDGEIVLLTVVEPSVLCVASSPGGGVVTDYNAVVGGMRESAEAALKEKVAGLKPDVPVRTIVDDSLDVIGAIHDRAREVEADLIVMATHGRTGIVHAFLGSTAEKVVRTSPVPVFTIRVKGSSNPAS